MLQEKKVNIVTLGCSKNVVDSETLMRQLYAGGFNVTFDSGIDAADIVVVNTCGFINDAKQESLDVILEFAEARKSGDIKKLFVTGCLSQRYKNELKNEIPEVDGFFGVDQLPEILTEFSLDLKKELLGERLLTTPSHYAYLKISEGCNRKCSFCAIPMIRGKHISKPVDKIFEEARFLASLGVRELILIAQDLTYYGLDIYKKRTLAKLLEKLSQIKGIDWIRLHYVYPADFPEDVLEIMNFSSKICKYLDIPLQHINDKILRSMKRGHNAYETKKLIDKIRNKIPDIAMRTTIIVGYPGETSACFSELIDFVDESRFERLGVFKYSHEEGTPAFNLKDDVPDSEKQERANELMHLQEKISYEINLSKIGKNYKVIVDKKEGDYFIGRTMYDSPEVDNEVLISSADSLITGNFYNVRITGAESFDIIGKII